MPEMPTSFDNPKKTFDPRAIESARDQVRAALDAEDPTSALRTAAIDIAGRGLGRAGTEAVLISLCEELTEAGREEESTLVAYVLDMMSEW
jgi:hypothetical protein